MWQSMVILSASALLYGEAGALGTASGEVGGGTWGLFWIQMSELGCSHPSLVESAQIWG